MNKRIKKKHLKNNRTTQHFNTWGVVHEAANVVRSKPVEKGFRYPVGSVRYRTYLKRRNLNKRHTCLGSKLTKIYSIIF